MNSKPILQSQRYGKSCVRIARVQRRHERHELVEMDLAIELIGDFAAAYSDADNSKIVATDTMKNTVYALAQQHGVASIEAFSQLLATHFLASYRQVDQVEIDVAETIWRRMTFAGAGHSHAFHGGLSEKRVSRLQQSRTQVRLQSGLRGLEVLKTTGSGFAGFPRDQFTTLLETDDRIFATSIEAVWPCRDPAADWLAARDSIRAALIDVFANQYSKSVQHTLFEMAAAAFNHCSLIDEIEITMPNRHYVPFNLAALGMPNSNEVFVATSQPHGNISARLVRSDPNRGR